MKHDPVVDAERKIGAILRDLERQNPSYCVTDISIHSIDIRNLSDDRPHYSRRVVIELAPNALNEWFT